MRFSCGGLLGFAAALWWTPAGEARAEWSAIAEQKTSYTTDAFQFSSARRLRLTEDPSQPNVVPAEKSDDLVWEPSLEVLRSSSNGWGKNELSVKAHGAIYTRLSAFNHGDYRIQDRQWLGPETSVLVRYRYVPNLFLGPNFERRTGSRVIEDERVTSHQWRAELDRRLGEDVTATLVTRYGLRLYNQAFGERDTQFFALGPRVGYRVTSRLTLTVSYLYERGLADGHTQTQFLDDVSYYMHMLSFGAELHLAPKWDLDLHYVHVRKTFTSGLVGDTHLGRFDLTHQGTAEVRYAVTPSAVLSLAFQHGQRTSTNALRDFHDSIVSLGGAYRF